MGPPLISGGNHSDQPVPEDVPASFNGAAADQRRKCRLLAPRHMKSRKRLQWGRR